MSQDKDCGCGQAEQLQAEQPKPAPDPPDPLALLAARVDAEVQALKAMLQAASERVQSANERADVAVKRAEATETAIADAAQVHVARLKEVDARARASAERAHGVERELVRQLRAENQQLRQRLEDSYVVEIEHRVHALEAQRLQSRLAYAAAREPVCQGCGDAGTEIRRFTVLLRHAAVGEDTNWPAGEIALCPACAQAMRDDLVAYMAMQQRSVTKDRWIEKSAAYRPEPVE